MHVVVIGAGLVGLSSALWLARSSHRVTIVDRQPPAPRDGRMVYAFGHGLAGLTLAGITGKLVEQIVDGASPSVDLHPFRPDRF